MKSLYLARVSAGKTTFHDAYIRLYRQDQPEATFADGAPAGVSVGQPWLQVIAIDHAGAGGGADVGLQ